LQDYEYRDLNRHSTETTYDVEGRLLTTRFMHPGSSDWVSRRSYDAAGRLIQVSSGKAGERSTETLYTYDENGRVAKVRCTGEKLVPRLGKGGGGHGFIGGSAYRGSGVTRGARKDSGLRPWLPLAVGAATSYTRLISEESVRAALDTNVLAYADGVNGADMKRTALELVAKLPGSAVLRS
jgi:YD repeat-containing protein